MRKIYNQYGRFSNNNNNNNNNNNEFIYYSNVNDIALIRYEIMYIWKEKEKNNENNIVCFQEHCKADWLNIYLLHIHSTQKKRNYQLR